MTPQLTDADIARHDATVGKVLTDADIAARDSNPQGYLSQVGTGLWNTVKGLAQVGVEAGDVAFDPLNAIEHLKKLKQMVVDPQVDQAIKAAGEWKKGNRSEAVGHALAAVLPGVGPAAANIGEKLGNQDYTGAAADATVLGAAMAAPHVAGAVADVAPRIAAGARVVGSGIKAAAPEVAAGTAIAGAGELVGHVVPGAEWATRLAGGQLMRSGVAKGLKAAREAMGPAAAAVVETPGMILARESNMDWANLSPTDQGMLETLANAKTNVVSPADQAMAERIAKAKASYAAQSAARPPMGPQAAPEPPPASAPTAAEFDAAATRPAEVGRMTAAQAEADFEQRRAIRTQGQPPAPGQQFAESQGYDWGAPETPPRAPLVPIPDIPPEAGPPAAAAPEPVLPSPPAGGKPAAAEIAAQLEASTRPDRMLDFLKRMDPKISADALDSIAPHEWAMVAEGAGSPRGTAPTAADIATIRENLTGIKAQKPAAAAAEFETKRTARTRKPKAAPAAAAPAVELPAGQTPAQALADLMGPQPEIPAAGPANPTASELRVDTLAQHLAADNGIRLEDLATIAEKPSALRQLDALGRSLGVKGSLAPGEISQIVDRVRELRGGEGPAAPVPAGVPPPQGPQTLRDLMQPEPPAAAAPSETPAIKLPTGAPPDIGGSLDAAANAAMQRMRDRGTFTGSKLSAGIPVDDLADMAIWGAAKLAKGTIDFAKWSKEMLAEAGSAAAQLAPQLPKLYTQAQKTLERHIANTAGELPSTQKLLTMYRKGIEGQDWYRNTKAELQSIFGTDTDKFVDFLAATSPNTTVAANTSLALKAYMQWKTGKPFTGYLPETIKSLNKAAANEDFGGLKVQSFRKNLHGDPIPVTVDRWIARALGFGDQPTVPQYKFMDYLISQIADKKGLEPRQVQAAIWKTIKDAEGIAGQGGESYEVLVRRKLLSDPDLAAAIKQASSSPQ